jgi:hypothetical protein
VVPNDEIEAIKTRFGEENLKIIKTEGGNVAGLAGCQVVVTNPEGARKHLTARATDGKLSAEWSAYMEDFIRKSTDGNIWLAQGVTFTKKFAMNAPTVASSGESHVEYKGNQQIVVGDGKPRVLKRDPSITPDHGPWTDAELTLYFTLLTLPFGGGGGVGGKLAGTAVKEATGAAAVKAAAKTALARGAAEGGGFASGITGAEIDAIALEYGAEPFLGKGADAVAAAARGSGFWTRTGGLVRRLVGGHIYNDANKRTALQVIKTLMERNKIVTGVSETEMEDILLRVAKGELDNVEEIGRLLGGVK